MFNVIDIVTILFLVFLEGLLSLDNALALALLVRHLPVKDQKKALTYGIWGAFLFRAAAILFLTHFMHMTWVKFVGGGYLLGLAIEEGFFKKKEDPNTPKTSSWLNFWKIIVLVEVMDITFSADSILAAVSVSQNYFVVLTGGILGIIMMRFAARLFVILMEKFPKLETTALLLVGVIGVKLIADAWLNVLPNSMLGWAFRAAMVMSVVYGFATSSEAVEA